MYGIYRTVLTGLSEVQLGLKFNKSSSPRPTRRVYRAMGSLVQNPLSTDHLIISQVSNTYNNPSSNHTVNISKIKGYEPSATIPAIAQEVYGKYRT